MSVAQRITIALPAFRHRNFRLFWSGQVVSLVGTQMQSVALGWLVLRISNAPFYLGLLNALAMLPILIIAMPAGMLADRMSKRKLLLIAQIAFMIQAVIVTLVVHSGRAAIWNLMPLAMLQGAIQAVESPTRQSFVSEMVPPTDVLSAVALNSSVFNASRIVGPAVAGFLIALVGETACFAINAVTFLAVIANILMMRDNELYLSGKSAHGNMGDGMKEVFAYIRKDRAMLGLIAVLGALSIFGMANFVLLPAFARDVLKVGPKGMGFLFAAAGAGALVSTITLAFSRSARKQGRRIAGASVLFALAVIAFSFSKNYYASMFLIAVAASGLITGVAMVNSTLQLLAPSELRGRVMGIYIFVFLGMMLPGSLLIGVTGQAFGPPHAVALGGAVCLLILVAGIVRYPAFLRIDTPATTTGAPGIPV